jgi:hypothetical protein
MELWLDIGTAALAVGAAAFWFLSAYGKLPPMIPYWDATPETDPFRVAIKFSARMNQWAAVLSGISALCMALKIMISRC